MEQVCYNTSNNRILVYKNMLQQGNIVVLKSFFCSKSSFLRNKASFRDCISVLHQAIWNLIATIESDSKRYAEVIGQLVRAREQQNQKSSASSTSFCMSSDYEVKKKELHEIIQDKYANWELSTSVEPQQQSTLITK